MKKSTTAALFLSPAFFFGFLALVWNYVAYPLLKNWTLEQIPKIISSQPYVEVSFKNIDLSLLKLQAQVSDLEIRFKKNGGTAIENLAPIQIKSIKAQIDLFSLVVGQFSFSNFNIDHLSTSQDLGTLLKLRPTATTPQEINLRPLFNQLDEIPIQKISLMNTEFNISMTDSQHPTLRHIRTQIKNIAFAQKRNSISVLVQDLQANVENKLKTKAQIQAQLSGRLDEKSYTLDQLLVQHGSSELRIESTTRDLPQLLLNPKTDSNFNARLKLDEIKDLVYIFKDQSQRLPQIRGLIQLNGQISTNGLQKNSGTINLSTEEVRFENLKFGNAKALSKIKNSQFLIDSILLEHPSGHAELKQISIQQEKPYGFKTDIHVQDFQLQKLFGSLNLSNIPADLKAHATAKCTGQIDNFKMVCDSEITAENISVQTDLKSSFHIIQMSQVKATGQTDLSLQVFKFNADLQIGTSGKSKVHGQGSVDFQSGFEMKFDSKYLDLAEIDDIANLGLKGVVSGELTTTGTTSYGVIDSEMNISNFILDRFHFLSF